MKATFYSGPVGASLKHEGVEITKYRGSLVNTERYQEVETVRITPEGAKEIFLWYDDDAKRWFISYQTEYNAREVRALETV